MSSSEVKMDNITEASLSPPILEAEEGAKVAKDPTSLSDRVLPSSMDVSVDHVEEVSLEDLTLADEICEPKDKLVDNVNTSSTGKAQVDPVTDLPAPLLPVENEKPPPSPSDKRKRILDSMKSQFNTSSEEDIQARSEPIKPAPSVPELDVSSPENTTSTKRLSHRSKSKFKRRNDNDSAKPVEESGDKEVLEYKTLPMNEEEQKQLEHNALVPPVKIRIRGRRLATVDSTISPVVIKQEPVSTTQGPLPSSTHKNSSEPVPQILDATGPLRRRVRASSSDTSSLELNSEHGTRRSSRIRTASPAVAVATATATVNLVPADTKLLRNKRGTSLESGTPEPKRLKAGRPSTRAKPDLDSTPPPAAVVPLAVKQQEMIARLQCQKLNNSRPKRRDKAPVLVPVTPLGKAEHMASLGLRSTGGGPSTSQGVGTSRRNFKARRRHFRGIRYTFGSNKKTSRNLKLKLQLEKKSNNLAREAERNEGMAPILHVDATIVKVEVEQPTETTLVFKPSVLKYRMQNLMSSPIQQGAAQSAVNATVKDTSPCAGLIASDAKLTSRKLLQAASRLKSRNKGPLNSMDDVIRAVSNGSFEQGSATGESSSASSPNEVEDKESEKLDVKIGSLFQSTQAATPGRSNGRRRRGTGPALKTSSKSTSPRSNENDIITQANPALGRILCFCREGRTPVALGSGLDGSISLLQEGAQNTQLCVPAPLTLCQAVDSVGSRLLGCSKKISSNKLRRPSARIPFMLLCGLHKTRLVSHHCCPGCGLFCTQGSFLVCKWESGNPHYYHAACQLRVDGQGLCPHCGSTNSSYEVVLDIKAKDLTCTQQQQPLHLVPNAKISFTSQDSNKLGKSFEEDLPVFVPLKLTLPSNKEITVEGLPDGFDKEMLEGILKLANGKLPPKTGPKNLYTAAKNGDLEKILHCLAAGQIVNQRVKEHSSQTPLHAAASTGHLAAAHILVQAGAELDIMDRDLCTPLMLAIIQGHAALVKYLIKANASVTLKGRDGMTSLHISAKYGSLESCHYIVSLGSSNPNLVNMQDDGGWTALVWGCEHKRIDIVRYLLQWKADPLLRDTEQNICLHWSAFSGSMEISELLLNKGCDVNSRNSNGETPLHIAARKDNFECVLLFLSRGADVTLPNNEGDTALAVCPTTHCQSWTLININSRLKDLVTQSLDNSEKLLCNDITKGKEQNPIQCVNGYDGEPIPTDYVYVTENCFTSHIQVDRTITSLQHCRCSDNCSASKCFCSSLSFRCWYDEESKLVPEFNFLDPPMLFECNRACECHKIMCHNRVVQHGITVRTLLFRTPTKGWGIRTLKPIRKGSFVCEYIGEIISDSEADLREDDSYLFDLDNRDGETYCIDARRYGNIARFINHACDPNLIPVKLFMDHQDLRFPRIAFFAARDIEAHEELGFDYGDKFWIIKYKTFTCTCGSPKCKYSEMSIHQTLENYQRRLQLEEAAHSAAPTFIDSR